ncbi:DNA gyrase inhibitor YacG [Methylobacterium gossipiicola]|uniref:DNA gyrase inhibitor YacG n=1 Tax=Methylobacterium gossipiicola TaxID=582675 RepID=A0A1I2S1D4_9HYPH|nr:DNA gyrase inhibitor YacG [Methylobacterium gossipiicola]SFG45579.1 hypothetical protein SAMN05192565_103251 [Methylobacterium gossipiicola]
MTGPLPWPPEPKEACPICGKAAKPEVRPFCSTRCADIDLGRWLTDRYAIPTADDEDEDAVPEGRA